jgi:uncharacterized protein YcaQ
MTTTLALTPAQARWHRLARQGLRTPLAGPEAVARALVGVQAQILPAAGLALWNRARAFTAADLARLLYAERSLVKLWGQRGTLHLYPSADWPLLYGAHADTGTYWERKAARQGAGLDDHEALVAAVAALLRERACVGRSDLRLAGLPLAAEHLSGWGGIFAVLVRRGLACHAEPRDGEARMAHRERWLPDLAWAPPPPEAANVELARRYLGAYGPATLQDLAYWRGRGVAEARRWAAALGDDLAPVSVGGAPMLALRAALPDPSVAPPAPDGWPVRLLGRFDPLLLAPKDKGDLVDAASYARVWRPAGHIEATLLVAGRLAGTWRYDWRGGGLAITIEPFKRPPAYVRRAAERQAQGVAAHFGAPLAELIWRER